MLPTSFYRAASEQRCLFPPRPFCPSFVLLSYYYYYNYNYYYYFFLLLLPPAPGIHLPSPLVSTDTK